MFPSMNEQQWLASGLASLLIESEPEEIAALFDVARGCSLKGLVFLSRSGTNCLSQARNTLFSMTSAETFGEYRILLRRPFLIH